MPEGSLLDKPITKKGREWFWNVFCIILPPITFLVIIFNSEWQLPSWSISDRWSEFSLVLKQNLFSLTPDADAIKTYMLSNDHSFTPLYSLILALIDIPINNMELSIIILNTLSIALVVFVVKKTIDNTFKIAENEKKWIIFLFISCIITITAFWWYRITDLFVLLIAAIAYYFNSKFINEPRNPFYWELSFITNSLILFTREIIWPMILFPSLLYISNTLVMWRKKGIDFKIFLKIFIPIIIFSIIIPGAVYSLFFFYFDLFGVLSSRYTTLGYMPISLWDVLSNLLLAFLGILFLLAQNIKEVVKHSENLPLLIWTGLFIISRIIMPGQFWAIFWFPISFSLCLLTYYPGKNNTFKIRYRSIMCTGLIIDISVFLLYAFIFNFIVLKPT